MLYTWNKWEMLIISQLKRKYWQYHIYARTWSNWNSRTLLVGVKIGISTIEKHLIEYLIKIDIYVCYDKKNDDSIMPQYFSSVAQSCPTRCDPMDCGTPGLPVPHHLLGFVQVHVHCISGAIQPSHSLMPSSALRLSQHQGLFQWVVCSQQMTKILKVRLHHQSFQWIFRVAPP